ncbi:hypothetical protein EDB87DRAFT_1649564 [Lactarius vividus]|nr:hypothetical protein EDB87DRAFT_1649564 [Lactarius vividus]
MLSLTTPTRSVYPHSVQGAQGQLGVESGPRVARTPSDYSPPGHSVQGVVTSSSQIGYQQHPVHSGLPASNSGRGVSHQPNYMSSVPSSSGPYASNTSATHPSPVAPASPTKQQWQEGGYRAPGGAVPTRYVTTELQPSPTIRTTASRVHSQPHGSSTSNIHQTRYNVPKCELPGCNKPAIFDQRINEQREYCEEHIGRAITVGFASCCSVCRTMPARLDSEFCSESCSNLNVRRRDVASPSTPGYHPSTVQHAEQQMGPPSSHTTVYPHARQPAVKPALPKLCENCSPSQGKKGKKTCSGECTAPSNRSRPPKQSDRHVDPDGLGQTCQECRGFIKEGNGRYCGKRCEEASRKPRTSRPQ